MDPFEEAYGVNVVRNEDIDVEGCSVVKLKSNGDPTDEVRADLKRGGEDCKHAKLIRRRSTGRF